MENIRDAVLREIRSRMAKRTFLIVAIEGRCGAGKTTLAAQLQESLACNVFHMDDFYLRPEQRLRQRLEEPGGNVDHERFLDEVLLPAAAGRSVAYRAYDCRTCRMKEPVWIMPTAVAIVEGSYSCHPALWEHYGLRVFLTVAPDEQLRRLRLRDQDKLQIFREQWIPMEERYFDAFHIQERCDCVF